MDFLCNICGAPNSNVQDFARETENYSRAPIPATTPECGVLHPESGLFRIAARKQPPADRSALQELAIQYPPATRRVLALQADVERYIAWVAQLQADLARSEAATLSELESELSRTRNTVGPHWPSA